LREVAAVLAVLAVVAACSRVPQTIRHGWTSITAPVASVQNRELAAVIYAQDPDMFLKAARIIPQGATYSVVVGDSPPTSSAFHEAIPLLFQYWLLPRRFTPDIHAASWVISYSHSSETLGIRYSEEINIGPTTNIDKVIR
jgi:hypothetical protein